MTVNGIITADYDSAIIRASIPRAMQKAVKSLLPCYILRKFWETTSQNTYKIITSTQYTCTSLHSASHVELSLTEWLLYTHLAIYFSANCDVQICLSAFTEPSIRSLTTRLSIKTVQNVNQQPQYIPSTAKFNSKFSWYKENTIHLLTGNPRINCNLFIKKFRSFIKLSIDLWYAGSFKHPSIFLNQATLPRFVSSNDLWSVIKYI